MTGRRDFIAALSLSALAPAALAQSRPVKVVGYLSGGAPPDDLTRAMAQEGLVLGRDFRFEIRSPPNWEPATLARAAAELVAANPDALVAWQGNRVLALAAATRTIPIVCAGMPDPVGAGLARTLRRPGGNVTGLSWGFPEGAEITMGLLKQVHPKLARVGLAHPPGTLLTQLRSSEAAARNLGIEWRTLQVGPDDDLESLLQPLHSQAMMVAPFKDPDFAGRIAAVGARMRIAMIGVPNDRALMLYGLEYSDATRRVAAILAKVLRGGVPAEIPFELPDRPSFFLNRRVARELNLSIPADVLLRATEVID